MQSLAIGGSLAVQLWVLSAILVLAGIVALIRHQTVGGLVLLAAAVIVGPGAVLLLT
jgi:surface polysaccharide O-acyltransferase-like enzyme